MYYVCVCFTVVLFGDQFPLSDAKKAKTSGTYLMYNYQSLYRVYIGSFNMMLTEYNSIVCMAGNFECETYQKP